MPFNIFGNATNTVSWIPNPTTRGSSNILQTCLITTSLCVWTAVHLNIREHDDPTFLLISYQLWRKLGWLILGLLAPEMLVYTAWYQRSIAKKFVEEYNGAFNLTPLPRRFAKGGKCHQLFRNTFGLKGANDVEKETSIREERLGHLKQRRPWTLVQGFYAHMGGFILDTPGDFTKFLPKSRMTLNLDSFHVLLKYGMKPLMGPLPNRYLESNGQGKDQVRENDQEPDSGQADANDQGPDSNQEHSNDQGHDSNQAHNSPDLDILELLDISPKELADKSNASGLAKALVCIQALWFCIQCFTRVSQSLPITLLELNTFAHSLCALIIYILWWYKPLDIEQPTPLPIRNAKSIEIWACLNRGNSLQDLDRSPKVTISEVLGLFRLWGQTPFSESEGLEGDLKPNENRSEGPSELLNYMWNFESSDGSNYGGILTALPFDGNSGVWWPHPNDSIPSHSFRLIQAYYCFGINHARWELGMDERLGHLDEPDFRVRNARVIRRAKNWPTFDLERPWIQLMFLLVALLYGGLHCLGWNSEFSSDVQQLLWRISSLIIIGAGAPVLFCYFLLGKVTYDFAEGEAGTLLSMYGPRWLFYVYKALKPVLKNGEVCIDWLSTIPIGNLLIGTMAMLLLAYLFARIYLVVECFIQLFHLPPGPDFIQPSWSTYFPHIG